MKRVIGVKFKQLGKIYHFECLENETYKLDDKVIVETSRGIEYGRKKCRRRTSGDAT